jgi:hypothetical protein
MRAILHASHSGAEVVPRRRAAAGVHPEVTGDIPQIIANQEGVYEGDLVDYFRILFFGAQNLNNPYHNLRHILNVTWLCHKAAKFYSGEIDPRTARSLLIAAVFHDFDHPGHSGPQYPDRRNIDVAIAALRRYVLPTDREALPAIEAIIRATEFPFRTSASSLDLAAKIIRDADLAQALSPAWIQQIVIGLAQEAGLAPLEMLRSQRSFLGALRFNTEWARNEFPPDLIAAKIEEVEALVQLLDDPKARSSALERE